MVVVFVLVLLVWFFGFFRGVLVGFFGGGEVAIYLLFG